MNTERKALEMMLSSDLSNRAISALTSISHTTISKYRKIAINENISIDVLKEMSDAVINQLLRKKRSYSLGKRVPDWKHIDNQMQLPNMTLQLLWQEYCEAEPESAYSFSSFAYKYRQYKRKLDLTMRQIHRAGECLFVDFAGSTIPYTDVLNAKEEYAQIFVAVLGCSNYTFIFAVPSQSLVDWVEAHNQMFTYIGGVPEIIVPDNLKSAITKPGRDLVVNRTYEELCRHYGVIVIPTRVRKPQDKAKVEVAVQIVSRWIIARLRNRKFFSIEEINKAIAELLWQLNERPFKKLPGCRRSRFEELDKPLLKPHPGKPFEFAEWVGKQKVGPDYHVHVKGHYYSVPHELVGEYVEARVTRKIVELLSNGQRVASHLRSEHMGGHTTLSAHQPEAHRRYAEQTPDKVLAWAKEIGPACQAVVQNQFAKSAHALLGLKTCSSLQRLAKEYGSERLESACRRAQQIGSLTLTSVRNIIKSKHAAADEQPPVQIALPLHHNVRGSDYYANQGGQ